MRKTALIVPLVALLALSVLTGCDPATPGGPPSATTPVSAEPSPSEEPVDVVTTAHHIRISTALIGIMDETDTAYEAIHDGVTADVAVPLLTAAFGTEPTITHHEAGMESGARTDYDWGGFSLLVPDDPTRFPPYSTWIVDVSAASVGGIPIYTGSSDIQVGDPLADAIAEQTGFMEYGANYQSQLLSVSVDPASVGEAGGDLQIFVAVYGTAGGAITGFTSPTPNWGV